MAWHSKLFFLEQLLSEGQAAMAFWGWNLFFHQDNHYKVSEAKLSFCPIFDENLGLLNGMCLRTHWMSGAITAVYWLKKRDRKKKRERETEREKFSEGWCLLSARRCFSRKHGYLHFLRTKLRACKEYSNISQSCSTQVFDRAEKLEKGRLHLRIHSFTQLHWSSIPHPT